MYTAISLDSLLLPLISSSELCRFPNHAFNVLLAQSALSLLVMVIDCDFAL
jgi:hypothetical protein